MKSSAKIIRIQGLLVFAVVAGLIAGFLVLFMDGMIKDGVEDGGSRILKSQVDVASLATSIGDQAIDISGLEIANADKLDENILEIGRIRFDIDAGRAFSKKVWVDDMRLEDIRFNQKRKTPAQPYRKVRPEEQPPKETETQPSKPFEFLEGLQFKSPRDILQSETLETLEAVKQSREDLETLKTKWETNIREQLSQDSLKQFKARIESLRSKGKNLKDLAAIQSAAAEIKALRNDIQTRLNTIKNFKSDLEKDIRRAQNTAANLKNLPQKDFDRLKRKYSLDLKGGSGLVGQMVSGPLKTKIDKAWRMYRKISPHLKSDSTPEPEEEERERSQGRTIKFNVERPSPDFLIRHAKLSIRAFDQDLEGRFEDLSDQPKIHGKPFVLNLSGKDNAKFKQFSLKVVMDRTGPQAQDLLETRMDAFKFDAMEIGRLATLDKGLANITGRLKIGDEKNLKGHVTIQVQDASFAGRNGKDDEITRLIQKVLRSVNHFYLKVGLSGTADHYSLKIDSDLDAILTKAVRNIFDEKVKSFEADLKKSIGASTGLPLSETQDLVAGLKDYRKILKGSESDYNNLLRQATEKALLKKVPGGGLLDKFKLPF